MTFITPILNAIKPDLIEDVHKIKIFLLQFGQSALSNRIKKIMTKYSIYTLFSSCDSLSVLDAGLYMLFAVISSLSSRGAPLTVTLHFNLKHVTFHITHVMTVYQIIYIIYSRPKD